MAALGLILDITILICLVFTIYYALKLSDSLKRFRVHRKEFDQVIAELSRNIDLAQGAIRGLQNASHTSGRELGAILDESRLMIEDLRLVNQASDSLAERLEGLAEFPGFVSYEPQSSSPSMGPSNDSPKARSSQ